MVGSTRLTFTSAGLRFAPALIPLLAQDLLRRRVGPDFSTRFHLETTMDWLCRAQDEIGTGGVSAGFSLLRGWLDPYPETTGYLVPTFFDFAKLSGKEVFCWRAQKMADWELRLQLPSGAIQEGEYRGETYERQPAAFDTGQVILGWCRAYQETGDSRYLDAASRAGNWLAHVQAEDGTWPTSYQGASGRAYDVRIAWSLLELHRCTGMSAHLQAAQAAIEWTLAQQSENSWFGHNAFNLSLAWPSLPFTHCIAYVVEGLFGAWERSGDERCWSAGLRTADRLLRVYESSGFLPAELDADWRSGVTYRCVPGDAQVAGIWLRVHARLHDDRYRLAALRLNRQIKETQNTTSSFGGIRGGVRGSHPFAGPYAPFTFVNWGAKFFADSLMLELRSGLPDA